MVYLEENKFKGRKKDPQCCINSFYSKDIPTITESVIKYTPVKKRPFSFLWKHFTCLIDKSHEKTEPFTTKYLSH